MNIRILNTSELNLLFQLFDYNDPDEMITEIHEILTRKKSIYSACSGRTD